MKTNTPGHSDDLKDWSIKSSATSCRPCNWSTKLIGGLGVQTACVLRRGLFLQLAIPSPLSPLCLPLSAQSIKGCLKGFLGLKYDFSVMEGTRVCWENLCLLFWSTSPSCRDELGCNCIRRKNHQDFMQNQSKETTNLFCKIGNGLFAPHEKPPQPFWAPDTDTLSSPSWKVLKEMEFPWCLSTPDATISRSISRNAPTSPHHHSQVSCSCRSPRKFSKPWPAITVGKRDLHIQCKWPSIYHNGKWPSIYGCGSKRKIPFSRHYHLFKRLLKVTGGTGFWPIAIS